MDFSEITQKTDEELHKLLAEKRRQLGEYYLQIRTSNFSEHHKITQTKRTIARILTAQRQRSLIKEGDV